MSETIKVSKEAKAELVRVAAALQAQSGRRVDLDEAIKHLLKSGKRDPASLASIFGSVPELSLDDLLNERARDEQRAKRKYGL
ncbi:MAG: hypothetical protein KGI26_06030 [Thaumarchaeota archaeon]|nr:hypothetical protein [Nitrososphaerota archaeon]